MTDPPVIRPATNADRAALVALLMSLPEGEHVFIKRSMRDATAAAAWVDDEPGDVLIAMATDRETAGAAWVVPRPGWSSHVSEIRLLVAPDHRGRGVAAALARAALQAAVRARALVVTVEALAQQQGVINLFLGLGFVPEALLTDHVRDAAGDLHDLVALVHSVPGTAALAATMGNAAVG